MVWIIWRIYKVSLIKTTHRRLNFWCGSQEAVKYVSILATCLQTSKGNNSRCSVWGDNQGFDIKERLFRSKNLQHRRIWASNVIGSYIKVCDWSWRKKLGAILFMLTATQLGKLGIDIFFWNGKKQMR